MLQSDRIFCVINVIKDLGLQQLLSYKSQNQIADFQSECLVKLSKLTPTITVFSTRVKHIISIKIITIILLVYKRQCWFCFNTLIVQYHTANVSYNWLRAEVWFITLKNCQNLWISNNIKCLLLNEKGFINILIYPFLQMECYDTY